MTEPKVGMKFGTYTQSGNAFQKANIKEQKLLNSVYTTDNGTYRCLEIVGSNSNGEIVGTSFSALVPNQPHVNKARQLEASLIDSDGLMYCGHSYKRPDYLGENDIDITSDVKFNRIYGEETYALDMNKNGVIDEGEIFNNDGTTGEQHIEKLDANENL
ncbi:MAG: hypothetical protein MJ231_02465 [bacterium]|nr:hypothetical protein [bacterium]